MILEHLHNSNRYVHSVMETCSTLHSFAKGTLQADPTEMHELFDWLWWRIMAGWDIAEGPEADFDRTIWSLCEIALFECETRFGWLPIAEPAQSP